MHNRTTLRRKIRQQRANLTCTQVAHASLDACDQLIALPGYRRAKRIAGYIANQGELDPLPALLHALQHGKQCYLPRLHPFLKGRMWFIRWRPGDPLVKNYFGIPEPAFSANAYLPAWMLDWVIMPLVAFDEDGNRLGMGQGFYDRTFALRRHTTSWKRPVLCGFAYHFQKTSKLQSQPWDIAMDMMVTDTFTIKHVQS